MHLHLWPNSIWNRKRFYHAVLIGARLSGLLSTFLAAALPAPAADTFDIVYKESDTPTSTVWRIETPNVKQKQTDYPAITFLPGDTVSVDAGGCVQTGGSGLTWKRYVNPAGPNADRLYHGLINIPSLTHGLVRIQDFGLNAAHQIPATLPAGLSPAELRLQLGYEDDGFGDNGYYKHDNGTGNQCKGSKDAFVIISIGHLGAAPISASSFEGIRPDKFRCEAAWAFQNFDTDRLSWSSFTNAFDFGVLDYFDPATYIVFLALRDHLALGGNCMGMSLLADVGEDQFIVDDLNENFWVNYKSWEVKTPRVAKDINTAHWEQLSVAFLHDYLANVAKSPAENASLIERDLTKQNYNYGLISIAHGTDGHVVVPLRVGHAGNEIRIDVYDPNWPCGSIPDTSVYPQLIINGDKWSFLMRSGATWSGSTLNDGLAYVPYTSSSSWRAFGANFTGIIEVVFGANAQVQQVVDIRGRKLYANGTQTVDSSSAGLGTSLFRLPALQQSSAKRPRTGASKFTTVSSMREPAGFAQTSARFDAEYAADYADSRAIFVTPNTDLEDLAFRIRSTDNGRPMRAMVHQGGHFFEVNVSTSANAAGATLVLHRPADLAGQGITLRSTDGMPLSATMAFGSNSGSSIRVQRTASMKLSGSVRASANQSELILASQDNLPPTTISEQMLSPSGEQLKPVRPLSVLHQFKAPH